MGTTSFRGLLLASLLALVPAPAPADPDPAAPSAAEAAGGPLSAEACARSFHVLSLERAVSASLCTPARPVNCLAPATFRPAGSPADAPEDERPVLSYTHEMDFPAQPIHFSMEYLRALRNAAEDCPDFAPEAAGLVPDGLGDLAGLLADQVDFINASLPVRNGIPAFENAYGFTHGMEQLEYAAFLVSVAGNVLAADPVHGAALLSLALDLTRSLDVPVGVHTGGIRGPTYPCGPSPEDTRPCTFFSARGLTVPGIDRPHFVLNQDLHVIRDTLTVAVNLLRGRRQYRDFVDVDAEADRLIGSVADGLYHLAWSPAPDAAAPDRIPGLAGFMDRRTRGVSGGKGKMSYYWGFYEYDPAIGQPSYISHERSCHYFGHDLDMMSSIIDYADSNRGRLVQRSDGPAIFAALDALTSRGADERMGDKADPSPLYQFWLSGSSPAVHTRRQACPSFALSPNAERLYGRLFDGATPR